MLVAVVGPSGAGKDTLMAGARARLAEDARFRFVRRRITRPAEAGGEAHDPLTEEGFVAVREAGGFALWWAAHGLLYGIPRDIEADLADGRVVVANLSRGVLAEASRYRLRVLEITAPVPLRAAPGRAGAGGCRRHRGAAVAGGRAAGGAGCRDGGERRRCRDRRGPRAGRAQPGSGRRSAIRKGAPGAAWVNRQSSVTRRGRAGTSPR